jgi:hypothetical protein
MLKCSGIKLLELFRVGKGRVLFLKSVWYWVGKPSVCLVCLCRAGDRHLLVALVCMSVCFSASRIQCRIKSLGPFKGRVSTLATHLRELLVSA